MLKIVPLFISLFLGVILIACTGKHPDTSPSLSTTETMCPENKTSCSPSEKKCPKGYMMALGCGGCVTTPQTICESACKDQDCRQDCLAYCKKCATSICPECALKPCTPNFSHCKCFLLPTQPLA